MPIDRNADPDAMAARIKELDAAQAVAPPVSPLVRLWAIAGEILSMFPKWLLVAALAVFLAFHAFSYYQQAQQQAAQTESAKAEAGAKIVNGLNYLPPPRERKFDRLDLSGCLEDAKKCP